MASTTSTLPHSNGPVANSELQVPLQSNHERHGDADYVPTTKARRLLQKLDPMFFHSRATLTWTLPHSSQPPLNQYATLPSGLLHRHRDAMRRVWRGSDDDRFLDPVNGRIRDLIVQATSDIYDEPNKTTWRRVWMRNTSSHIVRLAYWAVGSSRTLESRIIRDVDWGHRLNDPIDNRHRSDSTQWSWQELQPAVIRWLPSCIGLLFLVCPLIYLIFQDAEKNVSLDDYTEQR